MRLTWIRKRCINRCMPASWYVLSKGIRIPIYHSETISTLDKPSTSSTCFYLDHQVSIKFVIFTVLCRFLLETSTVQHGFTKQRQFCLCPTASLWEHTPPEPLPSRTCVGDFCLATPNWCLKHLWSTVLCLCFTSVSWEVCFGNYSWNSRDLLHHKSGDTP